MTISRDELSDLFDELLANIEQHDGNAYDVEKKAHQLESDISTSPVGQQSSRLTQKLRDVLQDIDHVESRFEDDGMTPPAVIENAKAADELLAQLIQQSLERPEEEDGRENQTDSRDVLDEMDMQPPPTIHAPGSSTDSSTVVTIEHSHEKENVEHAHHTKWVFTLICTYIFISHTGQNTVALLQYGVAF